MPGPISPEDALGVRDDCVAVMWQARHVRIDAAAINGLVQRLTSRSAGRGVAPPWDRTLHWQGSDADRTANYILALDALNFCFWGEPKWRIEFRGRTLDGYWALAGSLTRAIEEGYDLSDPAVMAGATRKDLAHVFRGTGEIPLLDARVRNLNEAGRVLLERFGGRLSNLLRECDQRAVRVVRSLAASLKSFDDVATYKGHRIRFYKRAQILVVDLVSALPNVEWCHFVDLQELTAFADYKVPQVLREEGVLRYAPDLAEKIDRLVEIPAGSEEEVEIRAATVVAVHDLAVALRYRDLPILEVELDGMLWHLGQGMTFGHPYHRTRTIFY